MPESDLFETEHQIKVSAAAETVYQLIADVAVWPRLFPPTVYVEHFERGDTHERIGIWATANGEVKNWISGRKLDPSALRVDYRQEVSQHPVAAMGGSWIVEPLSEDESLVRLLHDYRAVNDDPATLDWIDNALNHNSEAELAALKEAAEREAHFADLLVVFDDTVRIAGRAQDVYEFLYSAQHWERRLPHVERVSLQEDTPNVQILEMDTRTRNGSLHTTRSVRVCFPHSTIVYKQLLVPALASVHNGQWTIAETDGGVTVTSQHTVVIKESGIPAVLGDGAGVPEARAFIREALSFNSLATLNLAKEHVESTRS